METVSAPNQREGKGRLRDFLTYGVLAALFGIFLPWWKGLDFLDPVILGAYACLGVVFAGPAAAQAFAPPPASLGEALKRIAKAVLSGELIALALLGCGLLTVYFTRPVFLTPNLTELALSAALGLTASFALASMAAWCALRFSVDAARGLLRVVFLALLVLFYLRSGWLPSIAGRAAWIGLAVALVFVALLAGALGGHGRPNQEGTE
jgi:hypothetical protein